MSKGGDYEKHVQGIIRAYDDGKRAVHQQKRLFTATGRKVTFDIVVEEMDPLGFTKLIIFECKCWTKRVTVGAVQEFFAKLCEFGAVQGVMITTVGFQGGAREYAREKNIPLLLIGENFEDEVVIEMVSEGTRDGMLGFLIEAMLVSGVVYGLHDEGYGTLISSYFDIEKALRIYNSC